jgi:hypothetical protein
MKAGKSSTWFVLIVVASLFIAACGTSTTTPPPSSFTIGGTVSGLTGTGLVLQNNAGNNLTITANGAFTFTTAVASGGAYAVTVLTRPNTPAQTCVVTAGSGTANANVTTVVVTCTNSTTFTIGGTVSGLTGTGLVLQNNAANNLAVATNGAFTFTIAQATATAYSVTVFSQPTNPSQTCVVTNGSGTTTNSNITNASVVCTMLTFSVGGTVTGLVGTGLVLQNNGGNNLTITANGAFTFTTALASGAAFAVTVLTQPSGPVQNCTVTGGTGSVTSAAITSVAVACSNTTTFMSVPELFNNRTLIYNAPFSTGQSANVVLGQPNFTSNAAGTTASTMSSPATVTVDRPGNLYVGENGNCRVIQFRPPFTNGMSASLVFGQPNFTTGNCAAVTSATSLGGNANLNGDNVLGATVDASGNVWVTDDGSNRVVEYRPPLSNGMAASLAIGQPNLTSNAANQGGAAPTSSTLFDPGFPIFDPSGNLWIADFLNNRTLRFSPPFSTGMAATLVLGQADFTHNGSNQGGAVPGATTLSGPNAGAFDSAGNLWMADFLNNRVLKFTAPFTTDMAASLVLGQADFVSASPNRGLTPTAATLNNPTQVAFDSSGRLLVSDFGNNRTLVFTPPFSNGMNASLVIGQTDFVSSGPATTAAGVNGPEGVITGPPLY